MRPYFSLILAIYFLLATFIQLSIGKANDKAVSPLSPIEEIEYEYYSDGKNSSDNSPSIIYKHVDDIINSNSEEVSGDFPAFIKTEIAAVIVAFLIGIYCFTFLALLCDKYFLPSVEALCVILSISEDIAAATIMSMATSAPEFFINIISTFVSGSDLGLGTIVGSSSFNALFTPALGCLAVSQPLQLDWWPVTRDSTFYLVSVGLLVGAAWDGRVYWFEALILFIFYILYFVYIYLSTYIVDTFRRFVSDNKILAKIYHPADAQKVKGSSMKIEMARESSIRSRASSVRSARRKSTKLFIIEDPENFLSGTQYTVQEPRRSVLFITGVKKESTSLFSMPKGSLLKKILFVYTWPLNLILKCIMPNHIKYPRLTPITFLICVVCIGMNSYLVSWMITIIGKSFSISDTVMGFTLSAAGGSLPEAFSLVIKVRKGEGAMGVSNSLGANTMNILLSLSLPWLISCFSRGANLQSYIQLQSGGIQYTVLGLIAVVFALNLVLMGNNFRLSRGSGVILLVVWVVFLSSAISIQLFLPSD